MGASWVWFLLLLPTAFGLGWLASRFDFRQMRLQNRRKPNAYFRGLNHLLNNRQEEAMQCFVQAVQNDPDTPELQFVLGNLFRKRGEYTKAVRTHQHLLARSDLRKADKQRAMHGLATDYATAGLLDQAESHLRDLKGTAFTRQGQLALLKIYERLRDWKEAGAIAKELADSGEAQYQLRLTHYLCEQASQQTAAEAENTLQQAMHITPHAARPAIDLGMLHMQHKHMEKAWQAFQYVADNTPEYLPLIAQAFAKVAIATNYQLQARNTLFAAYQHSGSIDLLEALIVLDGVESAKRYYLEHLRHTPSLVVAQKWAGAHNLVNSHDFPEVKSTVEKAIRPLLRYRCMQCGFEGDKHYWHCPGCQAWDSYSAKRVEELNHL